MNGRGGDSSPWRRPGPTGTLAAGRYDGSSMDATPRIIRFLVSLAAFVGLSVGVPWSLIAAARARFGGASPLQGVPSPADWQWERIRGALTERLTEEMVTDLVIRICLVVVWAGVGVLLTIVVAEVVHRVRHGGLPVPDLRALGPAQSVARTIAAGLLVIAPALTSASRVAARDGVALVPDTPVVAVAPDVDVPVVLAARSAAAPADASAVPYVVRPGDSIYAIAARAVGPDAAVVAEYADRIVELNLGRTMPDGQRFTNAAFIDVGWVLDLPPVPGAAATVPPDVPGTGHVVERGETLWSIADDELGDPTRWPEVFAANRGRSFGGTVFDDPALIRPGWDLEIPVETPLPEPLDEAPGEPEVAPAGGPDRPRNRWIGPPPAGVAAVADPADPADPVDPADRTDSADPVRLVTPGRAAMLSAGLLTLLAVRRRSRLRRAGPCDRPADPDPIVMRTERSLHAAGADDRTGRVHLAIRSVAPAVAASGERVVAAVAGRGRLVLHLSGPATLGAPWMRLAAEQWESSVAAGSESVVVPSASPATPCPALVQIGTTQEGDDVYVDLEALEAIEVGGPARSADAIVTAMAATIAGSPPAEVTALVGVGVDPAAFFGHRHHVVADDPHAAFEHAAAVSAAAAGRSTFGLRGAGGDAWEPAVAFVAAAAGTVVPPTDRTGLAIVSAAPIHGPSSRFEPDGDAWVLRPLGLRCIPVGLEPEDLTALSALVASADSPDLDADATLAPRPEGATAPPGPLHPSVVVHLLGPVAVRTPDGRDAVFERSKAKELVVWLATHRERSTRSSARTALWELDVRDATFANVVSDARRSLARLVEPPDGDEWIGRTLTDALPLHPLVCTDADLVRAAQEVARHQLPDQAIATLRSAVELVVGTPFEGTDYLWPDAEGVASQLVMLATSVTADLAARCLEEGDVAGVFEATARGLQVLPGHEELIALRMRAHARAGDRAAVRHEWSQYERVLEADPWSDGEPSPSLLEVRRDLLNR